MSKGIKTPCLVEYHNPAGEHIGINHLAAEVLGRLMRMSMSGHGLYEGEYKELAQFKTGPYTGPASLKTAVLLSEASQGVQEAKRLLTVRYNDYKKTYECKFSNTIAWLWQDHLNDIIEFLENSPDGFEVIDNPRTNIDLPPIGYVGVLNNVSLPETTEFMKST